MGKTIIEKNLTGTFLVNFGVFFTIAITNDPGLEQV